MKKIGLTIAGLTLAGIMTFGINNNLEFSALNKGDTPAPQRPDLAYSHGHTGGISKLEAHGNGGGAPAYDHGRPPAPQA